MTTINCITAVKQNETGKSLPEYKMYQVFATYVPYKGKH